MQISWFLILSFTWQGLLVNACRRNDFECKDGSCISSKFVCDGEIECSGGEDEDRSNCPGKPLKAPPCGADQFQCTLGRCISQEFRCDRSRDCEDGSDERDCKGSYKPKCRGFKCRDSSKCVPLQKRCDGTVDCLDGSDEHFCSRAQKLDKIIDDCFGFRCDDGLCISEDKLCDHRKDCLKNEDESAEQCSHYECAEKCDHFCRHHSNSSVCDCRPGFQLVNNRQCQQNDVCLANGCSQTCYSSAGGVTCGCANGFRLEGKKRCVVASEDAEPVILYTSESQIRQKDDMYRETSIVFNDLTSDSTLYGFDNDIDATKLYAISSKLENHEIRSRVLFSASRSKPKQILGSIKFGELRDIAIDWITKNLYLIDVYHESIVACQIEESFCIDVITGTGTPENFVLDPSEGRMFWSVRRRNESGIYQANMDGSNMKMIRKNVIVGSLALDQFANRLYWLNEDTRKIEFMFLQFGTSSQLTTMLDSGDIFSLAVFGDSLYWSEVTKFSSSVRKCNKLTGENHTTLIKTTRENHLMLSIRVSHPLMQPPKSNPCSRMQCSHLCVLSGPSKAKCLCSKYYKLTSKYQCEIDTESYLVADSDVIFRVPSSVVSEKDITAKETLLDVSGVGAMAVDVDGRTVYAAENQGEPKIVNMNFDGSFPVKAVNNVTVGLVPSMTFDYFNRVLYSLDVLKKEVMIYNPSRKEISKIRLWKKEYPLLLPLDFAVDFLRNRIYVIMGTAISRTNFIDVYSASGALLKEIPQVCKKPSKITVDLSRGTPYIYDLSTQQIMSLVGEKTEVVIKSVPPLSQLHFWKDRLGWIATGQRGFFTAMSVGWKVEHITRSSWTTPTTALAFTGERLVKPKSLCSKQNGGCSHTCLSTQTETICICPVGMTIGRNNKTCSSTAEIKCSSSQFACANGYQCISLNDKCNLLVDCDDNSDEAPDLCNQCPSGMQKCATSSGCYSEATKCDGVNHCSDGSDEKDCPAKYVETCLDPSEYKCRDSDLCIHQSRKCNKRKDCPFGDDELNCPCETGRSCPGRSCLQKADICDGIIDCLDGQDEQGCNICPPNHFRCDNLCYDNKFLCDGRAHCSDRSDEKDCKNTTRGLMPELCAGLGEETIWCGGICVRDYEICNHFPDCPHGEDEANCRFSMKEECGPRDFKCDNGKCILHGLECDHEDDCGDGSDESPARCSYLKEKELTGESCYSGEFRCADGSCISFSNVCDSRNDCADGSDEGRHCVNDECQPNPCEDTCHSTPEGYRCSCKDGYLLAEDRKSCVDRNECQELGHCSQFCENLQGGYQCYCDMGYRLRADNRTCELEKSNPVLLLVTHNEIRAMSRRHQQMDLLAVGHESLITGLTFDSSNETVFWSEGEKVMGLAIGELEFAAKPVVLATHVWRPSHLSYDWATKSLYFVDGKQEIEVCNLKFTLCAHLPTAPLKHIRSLALNPTEGIMFYSYFRGDSDRSNVTGGVFRSNMDGTEIEEIIPDKTVSPSYLQIDFIHRRLYLADLHFATVEHFDFEGKNRKVLLRGHHMHSFALFPDSIFWSENDLLMTADWLKANSPSVVARDAYTNLMQVMHFVRQPPVISRCPSAKCSQLCLVKAHGYTCACDALYTLAADNKTCVEQNIHNDHEGLTVDVCNPRCENGGICIIRSDRGFCKCPQGYSGYSCDIIVGQKSSQFSIMLAAFLILAVIGVSIFGILYLKGNSLIPSSFGMPSFKLPETYRATDMKKLVEDDNENHCIEEEKNTGESQLRNLSNPLYAVNLDHHDTNHIDIEPEKVPEGHLLDL